MYDFYEKLYKTLILPKPTYCSAVWAPSLSCDIALLEKVRSRFLRLVCERCNINRNDIASPFVRDVHRSADQTAVSRIFAAGNENYFFNIVNNDLRGGRSIRSKRVAPTSVVNNLVFLARRASG